MKHHSIILFILVLVGLSLMSCKTQKKESHETSAPFTLSFSGAMRNVMHDGELLGTIALDTISNKTHLYGLGPIEYLTGEILILDGKFYTSAVTSDSTMQVGETFSVKAPFFVYGNVSNWKEEILPDSIVTIKQLEEFLNTTVTDIPRPFPFMVVGTVNRAIIHIDNLPKGAEVHSPEEVRQYQVDYALSNTPVEVVGFFSTEHKGIFTHHDSFVHMHLITTDKTKMGHVDSLEMMQGKAKLYLPMK